MTEVKQNKAIDAEEKSDINKLAATETVTTEIVVSEADSNKLSAEPSARSTTNPPTKLSTKPPTKALDKQNNDTANQYSTLH